MEKKETIETREYQSEFMKKIINGQPISNHEWFQYVANVKDCNPFQSHLRPEHAIAVFLRICQALADFGPEWRAKGYPAVIDAAEKHTLLKGRELVMEMMNDLKRYDSKIDQLTRQIITLSGKDQNPTEEELREQVDATKARLQAIDREKVQKALETYDWNIKRAAAVLGISATALRKKITKYELYQK